MASRDFPGLDEAQRNARRACIMARSAMEQVDAADEPCPSEDWQTYSLKLRGAAVMIHASAIEIAFAAGVVSAAHEADTSGLLDGEERDDG